MPADKLFTSLTDEEKIDFFVKCQEFLIKHHPKSEFLFREDNIKERKLFVRDFYSKYKGYAYTDDNICILYNYVHVDDPRNPSGAVKNNMYQPPHPNYNACSVDFVVFRQLIDCLQFCKDRYNPQFKYILFVKNNDVKLYQAEKLLERLNGPFLVFQ